MRWVRQQGLHYLEFPRLAQVAGIRHGIFLRFSEQQPGRYRSFNLGMGCGDGDEHVWRRRRRVRALFGFNTMVFARQVHGDRVNLWECRESPDNAAVQRDHAYLTGDGLVTGCPGQALFIQTADCQSVLIADPRKAVVANVHSGWRGSISNIIGRTVGMMTERFGCRPEDLRCGVGPSLGPCCAEFVNYRNEIPEPLWSYRRSGDRFDFWRMSLDQLLSAGVKEAHVETSRICTRCNTHLFYSYRGEGQTGRFAAVIGLRNGH
jgi:YfiH family protein